MAYETELEYGQRPVLSAGETVLWHGKPKKSAFVATKSLTMMPIAIIWLIIDMGAIMSMTGGGPESFVAIPFFALHLMPVWIWLGNVLTANRRWQNTHYYVTNRRIIIQSGFLAVNETALYYKDIRNTNLKIGLLDKLFNTGDVCFDTGTYTHTRNGNRLITHNFEDLDNAQEVYSKVQRIVLDMQTDIEYPNAYRPAENPGYNTDYRP